MLVRQLVDIVREDTQQPSTGGLLTDNEIARLISEGQESIYTDIRLIDETYFEDRIDVTIGATGEISLPASLRRRPIQDVRVINSSGDEVPLRYLYHKEIPMGSGAAQASSEPDFWYVIGDTIGIWPRPASSTIRIVTVRRPTRMIYARCSGAAAAG